MFDALVHQLCYALLISLMTTIVLVIAIWRACRRHPLIFRPIAGYVGRWLFPDGEA